jgi:3-deoxy-manno-octulosonate cytidylyltransferase (CMP-KDO synthetase)
MLLAETGNPLIQHTHESASRCSKTNAMIVATDDVEIFDAVRGFSGQVEMTSAEHVSGTDRVAEVASRHPEFDIVVNVQGDEPEIPGSAIDLAISILEDNPKAVMATLATPIRSRKLLDDPATVKLVLDSRNRAMYFSRSPIPCPRQWSDELLEENPPNFLQHIGLYAYRRDFLLKFPQLPKCREESLESLEQLRVLSAGYPIYAGIIDEPIVGIDTREDYELFVSSVGKR